MLRAELERYARQIVLPEIGLAGQERLRSARVLIVGAGGLGSPVALYLAAAGVGTLGIVDSDDVELSNLHRQILHGSGDIGAAKVVSARERLEQLNPTVTVIPLQERLDGPRAHAMVAEWDVVVDGSDNYSTRYAVNDACAAAGKPWVYGSVERFSGQLSVFDAATGPCYRCVYPTPPTPGTTASCEEIGVLGAVPGVIGSMQALEAVKLILDVGAPMRGRLLQIDFLNGQWRTIAFDKRADCPACGATGEATRRQTPSMDFPSDIEPIELVSMLRAGGDQAPRLIDVREPWEWNISRLDGAHLIPLDRIAQEARTFERDHPMVVYCHHGTRSAAAAEWLRAQGFRARNLTGGIDRWSREIDDTIRRY